MVSVAYRSMVGQKIDLCVEILCWLHLATSKSLDIAACWTHELSYLVSQANDLRFKTNTDNSL